MAIFEFKCLSCNHKFDLLILNDADGRAVVCPACGRGEPGNGASVTTIVERHGYADTAPGANPGGGTIFSDPAVS